MYNKVIRGGYARVDIDEIANTVLKNTPIKYNKTGYGYGAFVDAIITRAIQPLHGAPIVKSIHTSNDRIRMKMPYLGVSLYDMPVHERNKRALEIIISVVKTCLELREYGIQHTDVKHSNVLVAKTGETYLIDYNICSIRIAHKKHVWSSNVGTWEYASPEICEFNLPSCTSVVWSIGILLCYMYYDHPLGQYIHHQKINTSKINEWWSLLMQCRKQNSIGLILCPDAIRCMPKRVRRLFHMCTYWDPLQRIHLIDLHKELLHMIHDTEPYEIRIPPKLEFEMHPIHSTHRDKCLELMYTWCRNTNHMYLLCRSIAIFDRITWDVATVYAPICLAISYMLLANYIDESDAYIEELFDLFDLNNISGFMKSLMDLCSFFEWNVYEIPADVPLFDEILDRKERDLMFHRLYDIQKNWKKPSYTMTDLIKAYKEAYDSSN